MNKYQSITLLFSSTLKGTQRAHFQPDLLTKLGGNVGDVLRICLKREGYGDEELNVLCVASVLPASMAATGPTPVTGLLDASVVLDAAGPSWTPELDQPTPVRLSVLAVIKRVPTARSIVVHAPWFSEEEMSDKAQATTLAASLSQLCSQRVVAAQACTVQLSPGRALGVLRAEAATPQPSPPSGGRAREPPLVVVRIVAATRIEISGGQDGAAATGDNGREGTGAQVASSSSKKDARPASSREARGRASDTASVASASSGRGGVAASSKGTGKASSVSDGPRKPTPSPFSLLAMDGDEAPASDSDSNDDKEEAGAYGRGTTAAASSSGGRASDTRTPAPSSKKKAPGGQKGSAVLSATESSIAGAAPSAGTRPSVAQVTDMVAGLCVAAPEEAGSAEAARAPSSATAASTAAPPAAATSQPASTTAPPSVDQPPAVRAADRVAGMDSVIAVLREVIAWPVLYGAQAAALGVRWPRGLLLHGPPGTGKSLAVQAVAEECGAHVVHVTASMVFGSYTGESERRLREAFDAAEAAAARGRPAVVFLDEIDALCPRRDAHKQHEARVVAQLLTLMDGAASGKGSSSSGARGHTVVIGATSRPNALDPALRRPGRFDREIAIPVPSPAARDSILRIHSAGLPLESSCSLSGIAAGLHGYTGADLAALAREAAMEAMARERAQIPPLGLVSSSDFAAAARRVRPSVARGAEVDVAPVQWEDIGGLHDVKRRLVQSVEWPLRHKAAFDRLGLAPPRGVLLYGPPGCSKTTLVRAVATSSKLTVIPLGCTQLYSMYVGEGEQNLRDAFRRARLAAPSIVFLDEIDALAPKREEGGRGAADTGTRLLSALLTEMDGLEGATGVIVVGATNRPMALDSAMLRPGRLDVLLYVPPPDLEGRVEALRVHTRGMPLDEGLHLEALAEATDGFTGADLQGLCREAAFAALRAGSPDRVREEDFLKALLEARPSIDEDSLEQYTDFANGRAR